MSSNHKRPFRMKDNARSNSDLFAKRGDPWTTDKEGEKNYGRNLESENPDYDQYFARLAAELKGDSVGGVPVGRAKAKTERKLTKRERALVRISALRKKFPNSF